MLDKTKVYKLVYVQGNNICSACAADQCPSQGACNWINQQGKGDCMAEADKVWVEDANIRVVKGITYVKRKTDVTWSCFGCAAEHDYSKGNLCTKLGGERGENCVESVWVQLQEPAAKPAAEPKTIKAKVLQSEHKYLGRSTVTLELSSMDLMNSTYYDPKTDASYINLEQ